MNLNRCFDPYLFIEVVNKFYGAVFRGLDNSLLVIVLCTCEHTLIRSTSFMLMTAKLIYVLSSFHMLFCAFYIHIHVKLIKFPLNLVL